MVRRTEVDLVVAAISIPVVVVIPARGEPFRILVIAPRNDLAAGRKIGIHRLSGCRIALCRTKIVVCSALDVWNAKLAEERQEISRQRRSPFVLKSRSHIEDALGNEPRTVDERVRCIYRAVVGAISGTKTKSSCLPCRRKRGNVCKSGKRLPRSRLLDNHDSRFPRCGIPANRVIEVVVDVCLSWLNHSAPSCGLVDGPETLVDEHICVVERSV